jgi:hypothetical protein
VRAASQAKVLTQGKKFIAAFPILSGYTGP